jgi:hypothetical protein
MPSLIRNFVLATCTFVVIGQALAAKEAPNSVTFESISPAELALVVAGWQEKYDNSDIIIKGAKGKTYQADLTKLLDQLQSLENWGSLNKDERVKLGNSYESLRAQTDGGEASANQRRCSMERRGASASRQAQSVRTVRH